MKTKPAKQQITKKPTKARKDYKAINFRCPNHIEKSLKKEAKRNHRTITGEITHILEGFLSTLRNKSYVSSNS